MWFMQKIFQIQQNMYWRKSKENLEVGGNK